jgi:hypothetical protein
MNERVVSEYRQHLSLLKRKQAANQEIVKLSLGDLYLQEDDEEFFVFSHGRSGYYAHELSPEACVESVRALVGYEEDEA